ncbi:MAG TPA: Calx-beta domain-containing protein [Azospirillaceae bacterium]|nr:Calx-beta domain-containing protein [Azospirillaceae bacterium]
MAYTLTRGKPSTGGTPPSDLENPDDLELPDDLEFPDDLGDPDDIEFPDDLEDPTDPTDPSMDQLTVMLDSAGPEEQPEGNKGTTLFRYSVSLDQEAEEDITVHWEVEGDGTGPTAASPDDFAATSGTVVIRAGQTEVPLTVRVKGDTRVEQDERFTIRLTETDSDVLIEDEAIESTIRNDDRGSGVTAWLERTGAAQVVEGNRGNTPLNCAVRLSGPAAQPIRVFYEVQGIGTGRTAASPDDFSNSAGFITIPRGTSQAMLPIAIKGDTVQEGDEQFAVRLTRVQGTGVTLASATGTAGTAGRTSSWQGVIRNDDTAAATKPLVRLERRGGEEVMEGGDETDEPAGATYVVKVVGRASSQPITVQWVIQGVGENPALEDDFIEVSGETTIPANRQEAVLSFNLQDDSEIEDPESFRVRLMEVSSNARLAPLAQTIASGIIADDDEEEFPDEEFPDDGEFPDDIIDDLPVDGSGTGPRPDGSGTGPRPTRRTRQLTDALNAAETRPLSAGSGLVQAASNSRSSLLDGALAGLG